MRMSEIDSRVLEQCPDTWFKPEDLSSEVERPEYRCKRLRKLGKLEHRLRGHWRDVIYSEYRRK